MRVTRVAALLACLALARASAVEPGSAAPALSLVSLRAGEPSIALEQLRGRVVYVDFWASWCIPCRASMPALDALSRRYGPQGFVVVGINKDASREEAERFLRRVPVGFTLVSDAEDAAARAFTVKAMPSGYLLDRGGVVRQIHRGFTPETAAAIEREVAALLRP